MFYLMIGAGFVSMGMSSVLPVGVNQRVVTVFGRPKIFEPGLNFKNPLSTPYYFDMRLQKITTKVPVKTKDGVEHVMDLEVQYRIDEENLMKIYENSNGNWATFAKRQVPLLIEDASTITMARNLTSQNISDDTLLRVQDFLHEAIAGRFKIYGLVVEEVKVNNVRPVDAP